MCEREWNWKGGRLERKGTSLSIPEAYHAIPSNDAIRIACYMVLIPYEAKFDDFAKGAK